LTLLLGGAGGFFVRSVVQAARPPSYPPVEHLRESEERDDRFDALVRALPLGVVMIDRNTRVRYANRAAGAIFGFDRRRVRGLHLIEAVPSIELERRAVAALTGEAAGKPLILNGKTPGRDYAVNLYALTSGDDVTGALLVAEDQTEVLALERARQEFLTTVSHELRTPLATVKLMLETVLASEEDEAADLFLPQALNEVDRLASLVQTLLEEARTQSGALVLDLKEEDLESIVRPIVQSFEPRAAEKGVSLNLRTIRPVKFDVDRERFSQVIVNLVDNALKFTPAGGAITVETDAEDGNAVVRVRDTGAGIPYKDLPHVFERFYVAERSRTRGRSGAGLGLAIARQIVEGHGGTIEAQSMLGSGTIFTAKLPMMSIRGEG